MTERELVARYLGPTIRLTPEDHRILEEPRVRHAVLGEIDRAGPLDASGLLRLLLDHESAYRRSDSDGEFFENLYWCAFLLWRIGSVDDVIPLWRAKNIDFDTASGFDIQLLVGAGVDRTIEYLATKKDAEATAALERIVACRGAGDFDRLEEWAAWRSTYFGGDA